MKDFIRKFFFECNIPVTTNLKNDILLKKIIKQTIKEDDICIDIGCHKGEILELFIRYAPKGKHFAFEPIPYYYEKLKTKFPSVNVLNCALSDESGKQKFFWIKDKPAYSGLSKRKFTNADDQILEINVETKKLDEIIPENIKIKFIKIDVEGAELKVLQGAEKIIKKDKPVIAFEFGIGGSEFYNTSAQDMFKFFTERNYSLFDYQSFLNKALPNNEKSFIQTYQENIIYNFVAVSNSTN
ncbi:MAG TPA: FkbM family methyltransferase [Bacteroidia bacterium]|nr:FkbM family methyltransferase [Bacteroidia bacterium]